eukprot:m.27490 g.27490  ORF g.27490 m.27490 type:complete len:264 (-) comp8549_c0_seq1:237-1028(-)
MGHAPSKFTGLMAAGVATGAFVAGATCHYLATLSSSSSSTRPADDPKQSHDHPKLHGAIELVREGKAYADPGHWCNNPVVSTDANFIAVLRVVDDVGEAREAIVLLRGSGGYACVVALTDRQDASTVFNKTPTQRDYEAVTLVASQLAAAFLRLGIFPQLELLGNNSHAFCDGRLELGNTAEPFVTHVHVIGRGDPAHCYIADVPLRGQIPGEVMVPRKREHKWGHEGEIATVAHGIAESLALVDLHPSVTLVERRVPAALVD